MVNFEDSAALEERSAFFAFSRPKDHLNDCLTFCLRLMCPLRVSGLWDLRLAIRLGSLRRSTVHWSSSEMSPVSPLQRRKRSL